MVDFNHLLDIPLLAIFILGSFAEAFSDLQGVFSFQPAPQRRHLVLGIHVDWFLLKHFVWHICLNRALIRLCRLLLEWDLRKAARGRLE